MAHEKLTDRVALTTAASDDVLHIVDVSDNGTDAAGNSKKITKANLFAGVAFSVNSEPADGSGDISISTDEMPEGASNFYYTDTRVNTYLASQNISASYPALTITGNTTLSGTHEQKFLYCTNATAITLEIPTGLTRDCEVLIMQAGAGGVTIQAGSGVTLRNTSSYLNEVAEQYAVVGIKKVDDSGEVYVLTGERKV